MKKKISWCWYLKGNFISIDGKGENITEAFNGLSKTKQEAAIKGVKWLEIDGVRQ